MTQQEQRQSPDYGKSHEQPELIFKEFQGIYGFARKGSIEDFLEQSGPRAELFVPVCSIQAEQKVGIPWSDATKNFASRPGPMGDRPRP
jgi:hypothetical protein